MWPDLHQPCSNGQAVKQKLLVPIALALAQDGAIYVADYNLSNFANQILVSNVNSAILCRDQDFWSPKFLLNGLTVGAGRVGATKIPCFFVPSATQRVYKNVIFNGFLLFIFFRLLQLLWVQATHVTWLAPTLPAQTVKPLSKNFWLLKLWPRHQMALSTLLTTIWFAKLLLMDWSLPCSS